MITPQDSKPMLIVQDADLVSAITDPHKRVVDLSGRAANGEEDARGLLS